MMLKLRHHKILRYLFLWAVAIQLVAGCSLIETRPPGSSNNDQSGAFTDTFVLGGTNNWVFEGDDLGSTGIVNEEMVISVNAPNSIQFTSLSEPQFSDFILEVDAAQRSGSPESSYGVLFRLQDYQQFYRFEVTGTGLYMVERRNSDGTWTRLIPEWTPTSALNQGLNVTNRLKIIATGPELVLYANDVLLTQVRDDRFATGKIGLDAGTFTGGAVQVSFDNLTVVSGSQ